MKAECNLVLKNLDKKEKEDLINLFELEDKEFSSRARYTLKDSGDLIFELIADDAVALRSSMTVILKTLSIYERTKKIVDEEFE
jgi:tRNA threonylcarbamoyladenosine modification (KEOPS) complex  Pcc1 subunit